MSLQMFSRSYFVGLILYKETIIDKYTLLFLNKSTNILQQIIEIQGGVKNIHFINGG